MARNKLVDRSRKFIPLVLDAQIQPGSFEYALDYLVDNELDLSILHTRYNNDFTGAPAYGPPVRLNIVMLVYSWGLIYSRSIERACRESVLFVALSGDSVPQFTTVAKFMQDRLLCRPKVPKLISEHGNLYEYLILLTGTLYALVNKDLVNFRRCFY